MHEIIDITMTVDAGITSWPGLPHPQFQAAARIANGDGANVTNLSCCAHTGTHVDAPYHHFDDGFAVQSLELSTLFGRARVLDLTHVEEAIQPEDLAPLDQMGPCDILLTRTRNSTEKPIWDGNFGTDYIYVSPAAAEEIVRRGIKTIGVDCLSVESFAASTTGAPTHKILLRDGAVTIVEGLDLRKVEPGDYLFACLPIKLKDADGAPARAILVKDPQGGLPKAF